MILKYTYYSDSDLIFLLTLSIIFLKIFFLQNLWFDQRLITSHINDYYRKNNNCIIWIYIEFFDFSMKQSLSLLSQTMFICILPRQSTCQLAFKDRLQIVTCSRSLNLYKIILIENIIIIYCQTHMYFY